MLHLINKYLTYHFYVNESQETIFLKDETRKIAFSSSHGLAYELEVVFGLPRDEVKKYIEAWVRILYPSFPFEEYWKREKLIDTLPHIQQIHARTIANEIVAVQPMDMPSGRLFYLDYQFGRVQQADERNRNGRIYPRQTLNNAIQNPILGELNHGTATDRLFNDWMTRMGEHASDVVRQLYRNQLAHLQRPI